MCDAEGEDETMSVEMPDEETATELLENFYVSIIQTDSTARIPVLNARTHLHGFVSSMTLGYE